MCLAATKRVHQARRAEAVSSVVAGDSLEKPRLLQETAVLSSCESYGATTASKEAAAILLLPVVLRQRLLTEATYP